jgi:hypothetical protein
MKFLLIAFTITLLAMNTLDVQHFNGGVNMYDVTSEKSSNAEPITGFHVGIMGHYHLNNQFALQPEIVHPTQGSTIRCQINNLNSWPWFSDIRYRRLLLSGGYFNSL